MNKSHWALLGILASASACNSGGNSTPSASQVAQTCSSLTGSKMVGSALSDASGITAAPRFKALNGHMFSPRAQLTDIGKADENEELPVTLSLELNHPDALEAELAQIYNPNSPKYRQFLSPEEFRSRFAPTADESARVARYLESQGLRSVQVDPSGLFVRATGKVSELNTAFGTELHQFRDTQGNTYRGVGMEPQVPAGLPIQGIHGLQNLTHAHTHATRKAATGPSGGFSPSDIRTAYNIPSSLDGSGQTLAVFELDGYATSSITTYEQKFNLPAVPLENVLVDGYSGAAGGGAAEVTLDIELMIAVAPKASKILVYEGANSEQGIIDTYARIANDNRAQSVSTSWGDAEDTVTSSLIKAENTVFMQMAAQGQTIYSASGDVGAKDDGSTLSIDDPSGQPYVVAVGGTTLATDSSGARQSETTWNNSTGGSGGGVSTVWTIPAWQKAAITSASKGSTTMRNIPDVALNADMDTGYAIYTGGSWGVWGGTSCSAPLWAAFNALVNQQRALKGMGPVGYITPMLYAIGASSRYESDFFDIADNSTNGYYPAVAGFDDATGWGSFNAANLIADLASPTVAALSSPSNGCTAQ